MYIVTGGLVGEVDLELHPVEAQPVLAPLRLPGLKIMFDTRFLSLPIAALLALGAVASGAQSPELSQADRKWMEEDVSVLITEEEIRIFTGLRSDEDRRRFKEIFWSRRDPDWATRENEIREEVQSRQRTADRRFRWRAREGSQTDLGEVYVLLGAPARTRESGLSPGVGGSGQLAAGVSFDAEAGGAGGTPLTFAPDATSTRFGGTAEKLIWSYPANATLGIPDGLVLTFRRDDNLGRKLDRTEEVEAALDRLRDIYVRQPDLTYELDVNGRLAEPPSKFDPNSPAKRALRELMDEKKEKADIAFETTSAFFRSGKGSYVPLRFEIDSAPLSWVEGRAKVTVFGGVEDIEGELVHRFEEQAILVRTDGEPSTFDIPLRLEPGTYTFSVGVLDDDTETWGAKRVPVFVPGFEGESLQMSSIVLYTESQEIGEASPSPGNAFQFGGRRFTVPGSRTLRPTDRAGILFFVYGFRATEADRADLTVDYRVLRDGHSETELEDQPLETHQGQAVGNVEIPLANLLPGTYRVNIRVSDRIRNEVVEKQVEFLMEPESYSLAGYSELIEQYRAGDVRAAIGALSRLSALEVRSVARAAEDYRKQALTDDELRTAALFHTDVAIASGREATHFDTAREYLQRVGDTSLRRRWEQLWFLAISEHIATAPAAWTAFPLVEKALQSFPQDLDMALAAGMVHEAMGAKGTEGRLEGAEALYRSILEKEPDHGEARVRLGRVLQLQGRTAEALRELESGLGQTSERTLKLVALLLLGELHDGTADTVKAIDSYRAAVETNPECQAAAIALSRALLRAGNARASDQVILEFLRHAGSRSEAPDLWLRYIGGNAERVESRLAGLRQEISK